MSAFAWVNRSQEALLSEDYLRVFPELPRGVWATDTSKLTPMLGPQARLLAQGLEVITAYFHFLQAGEQLRATVKRLYVCAFAMLTVEAEQMLEEGRGESPAWRHSGDEQEPENTKAGNR
ncbi:hypothetical protein JQX13_45345 [Archangium violaceum]|uniref:hypothetical protein n=1 Tax=Archangium violaceum TaxID=83451 RepID=UPI00193B943A|nr:hypothetical protein [Archangium violaceum]QRK07199.1 hypothetical protein JQX13_45345 [Archangium violaceum]